MTFGLGTGTWAPWLDLDKRKMSIRHHEARMVVPLTRDEGGIMECAFPAFGIVKLAVINTRVDMSPYGQSVFADAVDAPYERASGHDRWHR